VAAADVKEQLQSALGATYTLERELGRGGMAAVFLAIDVKHKRRVALKVLHPDLAAALGPERFRREIELAAQLQHPHILSVHDSGETPTGLLWFTMPYVEGESLRERLTRERQLPLEDALRIAGEGARALDYAHRHGVIHRDIKPENILLTKEGDTLVADFGIGRALGTPGIDGRLTETGVVVGTPAYMSPEQSAGERDLDGRTDIYSLGTVLYEMLAGEPPFVGATAQAMIAKRMAGEIPSARQVRPSVPETVEQSVRKALALVPADRFSTAGEFARALAAVAHTASAPVTVQPPLQPPGPAAPPVATIPPLIKRRIPPVFAALALGFLVGVGVLFAWRSHNAASSGAGGPVRLAVLPFDNLGDSADAYFAEGVTDAVRGKLTSLPGLEVTAPASSGQYRHTTKTPQQIGQELGVRYLLVGKVRWAKAAGSASRVEVSPALIDATSGSDKWEQPFDAPLTDVFQVQADIAGKVAQQLKVALTPAAQQTLAQRPTQNLDAYDAYLRGKEIEQRGLSAAIQHAAAAAFREAVERDSTFALAWAGVASTYTLVYSNGVPTPALRDSARLAAERAVALGRDLPEAHAAMGLYFRNVAGDIPRALAEDSTALARAPNNVLLLTSTAITEQSAARWTAGVAHLQQAARLDPRDDDAIDLLGRIHIWLRHNDAAREVLDRGLSLDPRNVSFVDDRVMLAFAEGDLAGARGTVRKALATIDSAVLVAYLGNYYDLGWVFDSAQEHVLLGLGPASFDNDRATWAIVLAQQYSFRGQSTRARAYADTARAAFETNIKTTPGDAQQHVFLGLALAYLGRKADAVREGQHSVALLPISTDAYRGAYYQHQFARIYMLVGQPDKALDLLEPLLKVPYYLTPAWLKIDPNFAPLRGNPRFERLVSGP
jgi:TolB-like protein/tetratricopeptide (TPR) repeat protein/tRNA A-37 threonylcarbamoyl transferase component Bud32